MDILNRASTVGYALVIGVCLFLISGHLYIHWQNYLNDVVPFIDRIKECLLK